MKPMVEKITNASIAILKRDGIDGLNMRAIAGELKLRASALYKHIREKREIYYLISEYICEKITCPENLKDPRNYLIELNKSFRKELLGIKHSASIFGRIIPNSPKHMEFFNKNLAALSAMGVESTRCFFAAKIINNYVMSSVWDEEFFRAITRGNSSGTGINYYRSHLNGINYDRNFMYGLEAVLDGITPQT